MTSKPDTSPQTPPIDDASAKAAVVSPTDSADSANGELFLNDDTVDLYIKRGIHDAHKVVDTAGLKPAAFVTTTKTVRLSALRKELQERHVINRSDLFSSDGYVFDPKEEQNTFVVDLKTLKHGYELDVSSYDSGKKEIKAPAFPTKPATIGQADSGEPARKMDPQFPELDIIGGKALGDNSKKKLMSELTTDELKVVLKNAEFGIGILVEAPSGPRSSSLRIFDLPAVGEKPGRLSITNKQTSQRDVLSVRTERARFYQRAGWNSASVGFSVPLVADFSSEFSCSYKDDEKENVVKAYMFAREYLPQGTLKILQPTLLKATSDFEQAVRVALDIKDGIAIDKKAAKVDALGKVLRLWGQVVAVDVDVGACITVECTFDGKINEVSSKTENEFGAAASAEIDKFSLSGGFKHGSSETQGETISKELKSIHVFAYGGDNYERGEAWRKSAQDYRFWDKIRTTAVVSTTSLLPDDLQKEIQAICKS